MYAFLQRSDTSCLDEPLYGHYLKHTQRGHPGAAQLMANLNCDAAQVIQRQILGPCPTPVLFCKQMAHHLVALDESFLEHTVNVILTRDPSEVLTTLVRQIPNPGLHDTGYQKQVLLLQREPEIPVLDARQLLLDPAAVLKCLSRRLGLAFEPAMLCWPPGPKAVDGIWAEHWYQNVHRSTGFAPYQAKSEPIPRQVQGLAEQCQPLYEQLLEAAIKA